ncbi:MAG: metallophosphoesterase [Ruminococcus sp.]|nr:metallophosphoesterase [Ruminococcus sp.]
MWGIILIVALALLTAGLVYMTFCFSRFGFVKKLAGDSGKRAKLIGLLCVAVIMAVLWIGLGLVNAAICIVNLLLFFLIGDAIGAVVRRALKKEKKHYYEGYIALAAAAAYLCVGFYLANGVWEKDYKLDTDKEIGQLRIVQFADSHVGTTFDGEGLNKYIDQMNELEPDIVVITGDFVDDDTSREDMIAASAAVGRLKTKYGVYYCFGNHDKGYYDNARRGYNSDDLVAELEKNGVTVLEDEAVLVDDRFYVIGRADKSEEQRGGSRKAISELMQGLDTDKYTIVLDHQPNDYDAEAAAKADLVLSGHTHGGQMLPINRIGEWIGANDFTYGYERIDDTDFIVTSGISDWAIDFKTGCCSEFVVIDVG